MVRGDDDICPKCGGSLKYYDTVKRTLLQKSREKHVIKIKRLQCILYGSIHRSLIDGMIKYKQYDSEIIFGVIDGYITTETLGYEDYPCEVTMNRWRKR